MKRNFRVPSKILHQIETERENKRLYFELNSIRPTMSFSLPRECSHLKFNKKREQIREERYTEIERENRILLEKINSIIQNRQSRVSKPQTKNSLNLPIRARHQREISLQNLGLLKRIQSKKSFYTFKGQSLKKPSKYNPRIPDLSPTYSRNSESFTKKQLSPLNHDPVLVHTGKINIQDKIFSIQVFKSHKIRLHVQNEQTEEKFLLELSQKETKSLIGNEEDWEKLIKYLHLEGNDLVLCQDSDSEIN